MSPTDQAPRAATPIAPPGALAPRGGDGPDGFALARVLLHARWVVAGFATAALLVAGVYLLVVTPTFRAEALLRIEERREPGATPDPLTARVDGPPVRTEMEMFRSRTLLAAAAERAGLDILAEPRRVPLLSKVFARFAAAGAAPRQAPLGLDRFGWGGERIAVTQLQVPDALLDVPLVLTVEEDGGYRLATRDGATLVDGGVGRVAEGTDPAGRPVRVLVSQLAARRGTEFELRKLRLADVVASLQLVLVVEERGRDTGVVAVRLEGADRDRVARTLDALVEIYLRENRERTFAEASRTLRVLDERLPTLKAEVERAEHALEEWQRKNGSVEIGAETRAQLERSVAVERRIADLETRRDELSRRYSDEHPAIGELNDEIGALRLQQRLIDGRLRALPSTELAVARLTRAVQVATALYLHVLDRAQQFRIASAGATGSAHLVDPPAAPHRPVAPRAPPILAFAVLLGACAGTLVAIVRSRLGGADNALEVEVATGIPVLGTVPHSTTESSLARAIRRRLTGARAAALHAIDPGDSAVEDLRTLRTNLAAALRGAKTNVVVIGGPSPGVGKSFVCVNLALLLAAGRRKVLLIDADLRRGRLHREFGLEREPGLAEVLSGSASLDAVIRPSGTECLDVIGAGTLPEDPTALLENPTLQALLAEAAKRYDVVLVDTAAILAVTDPALVARHAGLSLLVLRAGEHPVDEIALAVKRLRQSGARIDGAILNDLRSGRHLRYRYEYRARAGA